MHIYIYIGTYICIYIVCMYFLYVHIFLTECFLGSRGRVGKLRLCHKRRLAEVVLELYRPPKGASRFEMLLLSEY